MRAGLVVLFSLFVSGHVFAAPEDINLSYQVGFTEEEIKTHNDNIDTIIGVASKCLDDTYAEHLAFFNKHGVSKFYGDRRSQHKTRQGRIGELKRFGAPTSLIDELEPISCIGLTLKCLEKGFDAAGNETAWNKILNHLYIDNKVYGTDLQILLQKLGWKLYYWNPNPARNAVWDEEDKRLSPAKPGKSWNPVWGGHVYRHSTVMNRGIYYESYVDDAEKLVGFGSVQPAGFAEIPFFVGIAHAGYHVFPGRNGQVIEAHSTRKLNSIDNLEFSEFNPLGQGGGPRWTRTEKYRSGLIAVPPGY